MDCISHIEFDVREISVCFLHSLTLEFLADVSDLFQIG